MYGVEVASVPLAIETSYEGLERSAFSTNKCIIVLVGDVRVGTLVLQNLQNIVRRVKMRKCDYHFVEIMACPSGCMNGGGQVKPKPGQSPKELIKTLETIYLENVIVADPFKNSLVKSLYDEWLEPPGSEKAKKHVHTEYYPVVKSITAQLHNW
ncbi:protein NAR1 [Citrus sinensis]|uniref:Protein NAR1 n=1 Tax=Citrus sinensis TaxID=2711 RepID=A0ACB8I495_CITSI|nr:protein NAR1 [Citrus sinensis]